jgi:hypothetical protein
MRRAAIGSGGGRRRLLATVVAGLGAAALCGGVAAAEEGTSRAEYVAQLEAICKPGALATEKAVKGVKGDIEAERLAVAAAKFSAAARIFDHTVARIAPVPRPPADQPVLAKWFVDLEREEAYLKKIAAALHAGETILSQRYVARFIREGNRANNAVLPFGFNYCAFRFSRFE